MNLIWQPRNQPLEAGALWITHDKQSNLTECLSRFDSARLSCLSYMSTEEGFFLTSTSPTLLPWIDQALWLGKETLAPDLWLPTLWQTNIPTPLLMRASLAKTSTTTALIPPENVLKNISDVSDGTLMVGLTNPQPIKLGQLCFQTGE